MAETRDRMYNEWDKQRRLSDAELIKGGAEFIGHLAVHTNKYQEGLLLVTEHQRTKAQLVRDVSFRVAEEMDLVLRPSPYQAMLENTRLDEPVADHWVEMYSKWNARVLRALGRQGIESARDLLVIGRKKALELSEVGPKTADTLAAVVAEQAPGLEWLDKPSPWEIASFCESLYQVNAKVLLDDGRDSFPNRMSVRDVLVLPPAVRVEVLAHSRRYLPDYLQEEFARDVYGRAELFALRFDLAKGGILTNPEYLAAD